MAIIPTSFRDWFEDFDRQSRMLEREFGMVPRDRYLDRYPDRFLDFPSAMSRSYFRPWRNHLEQESGVAKVKEDKDKFQAIIDVQQFSPEEITVKTIDNSIVVEGKHEEKKDQHGYISRQFSRRYLLPEGHDVNAAQSNLSSDGVLTVTVPKLAIAGSGEKTIPITHTGAPAVKNA